MLGHRELATTQIYAKVLDKKKQVAIMLFPDLNEKDSVSKKNKKQANDN